MYLYKAKFTLADLIGLFSLSIRPVTYFHVSKSQVNLTQSHVVVILCLGPTLPQRAVSAICYISSSVVAASSQL